jgi:hypothetical protein
MKYITLNLLIILLLSVVMYSCDINKAEEIVVLRTDTFSGFTADHVDRWVIISDSRGNIIDYKNTSDAEGILEFRGNADDTIIVTELNVASFENGNETRLQHMITSYMGVPVGGTYTVAEPDDNNTGYPDPAGTADLTLLNYVGSSDPFFSIGFSDSYNGYNSWLIKESFTYDGSTYSGEIELREDPIDIFITAYDGIEPRFLWVRDVSVDESVIVDFESFELMIPVNLGKPVDNAYIRGQIEPGLGGRGYELSRSEYWRYSDDYDPQQIPIMGYVEGFEIYDVYASHGPVLCCEPHERVTYHKLGSSVPHSIEFPDASLTLSDGNLFSLDYTFNRPYTRKSFFFSSDEGDNSFWWSIHAPEGLEIAVPKIPNEIRAQYPYLNRSELPLQSSRFVDSLDGYSFRDFVKGAMENNLNRPTFENLEYYFQVDGM